LGIGLAIIGGERVISPHDELMMQALTWDPVDPQSTPDKEDPLIGLTWSCKTITATPLPCTYPNGTVIAFTSKRKQSIEKDTFTEGKSYTISITASKGRRSNTYSM
jgi:hypothetical protein